MQIAKSFTFRILGFLLALLACGGDFAQAQMKAQTMQAQTMKAQGGNASLPSVVPVQPGAAPIAPTGQTPFPKFNPVPNVSVNQTQGQANNVVNNFNSTPQLQQMPNSNNYDLSKFFPGTGGYNQNGIPYPNGGGYSSDGSMIYPRSSSDDGNIGYSDGPALGGRGSRCGPKVKDEYARDFSRVKINPNDINKLAGAHCGLNEQPTDPLVCMACNLQFEVDPNDSYAGYVAVARSVMTRAMSGGYPQTVCKVVYQHNGVTAQYSWTFEDPAKHSDHMLPANVNSQRMQNIFRAAVEAFEKGPNGYTNYYAQNLVYPKWAREGSCSGTLCTIEHHTFCAIGARQDRKFDSYLREEKNLVASIAPLSTAPAAPAASVPGAVAR